MSTIINLILFYVHMIVLLTWLILTLFREVFNTINIYIFDITTEENILNNFNEKIFYEEYGLYTFIWNFFYIRDLSPLETNSTIYNKKQQNTFHEIHKIYYYHSTIIKNLCHQENFIIQKSPYEYYELVKNDITDHMKKDSLL